MSRQFAVPDFRFAALCLSGAAMPWSKAGLSIGMGLLVLASLLHARAVGTFRSRLGAATLALAAALLISALISEDLGRGWKEFTSFWPLLFPFLGAAAVRDAPRPRIFLTTLLASTSVATFPALSHLAQQLAEHGRLLREFTPLTNKWLYALALCSGALVTVGFARGSKTKALRISMFALLALHLLGLIATRRRVLTLLGIGLVGLLSAFSFFSNRRKRGFLVIALGGAALLLTSMALNPRMASMTDFGQLLQSEQSRVHMWEFAIDQYQAHPVLGLGLGDVRNALHAHADQVELQVQIENQSRDLKDKVTVNLRHAHCHSNFLHTLAATGSIGFLAMLIWMMALPATLVRGWNRCQEAVMLGLSSWTLFFLSGVTDASLYSSSRLSAFTLIFAYAWGMLLRPHPPTADAAID